MSESSYARLMLTMKSPDGDIIQVGTEYLGPGSWRSLVCDQDGKVLEVLGMATTATELIGITYGHIIQLDLQGWRSQRTDQSE